jgi:hypothetical protein
MRWRKISDETVIFAYWLLLQNQVMLKFLLALSLIGYLLYKVGGMFFRAGAASQQFRRPQDTASNVNANPVKDKKSGGIKGGDYVDYEEVK